MHDDAPVRLDPARKVEFNLNWTPLEPSGASRSASDLDLGCMFKAFSGDDGKGETRGVVQSVGGLFGSAVVAPSIELILDDIDGQHADGENLRFHRPELVKFAVVFATIYDGVADFRNVRAELQVKHESLAQPLTIPLDSPDPGLRWCALVACGMDQGSFVVVPQERYFLSARHADNHYGFRFDWTVATKPYATGSLIRTTSGNA